MTHICVSRITNIGSDNGLSPGRCQAIIWTNAEILLIEPFGTNFNEIFMAIHTFSFKKMHLNMSSGKWRPFCLSLNVLIWESPYLRNIVFILKYKYFMKLKLHATSHWWNGTLGNPWEIGQEMDDWFWKEMLICHPEGVWKQFARTCSNQNTAQSSYTVHS